MTFSNPVYAHYFADPFIWRHDGVYWAVGTGPGEAAGQQPGQRRAIPLLRSEDLRHWQFIHLCLVRPDPALGDEIWAPEVAYAEGRFYLYYSVGHGDKNHQLRVAAASCPQGPYIDVSGPLNDSERCPFAIDPHPFQDEDGGWWLFYARDFLDNDNGARPGTALAVDRLLDMTRLAQEERTVLRATADWQRFRANRPMYGRVFDWHTLEGPFVRRRNGRYYCFYSGGCWENASYGVDYGVADRITGPWENGAGQHGPRVLRTLPGLLGPGHNSIVSAPDGHSDIMVYHAWDAAGQARRMHLSPLGWTDQGPQVELD